MENDELDQTITDAFQKIVGTILERVANLEEKVRQREFEMIVYKNAYENLIKELNEMKTKLKTVPAGKLIRKISKNRVFNF